MKREDLISWGLTDEQVKKVMAGLDGDFVTKTRFNEVNEENKTLKQSVSDRDKQLNDLKKSSGDNAELKAQIEELQKKNTEQAKAHAAEMAQLKLDNAVDTALTAAVMMVHAAATGTLTAATAAEIAAQNGLNGALLACPITWIVMGVIALIAVLLAVTNAIAQVTGVTQSGVGIITGVISVGGAFILNTIISLINSVITLGVSFWNMLANFAAAFGLIFNDPIAAIEVMFLSLFNFIVSIVSSAAGILDTIFGSDLQSAVQGFQDKIQTQINTTVENAGGDKPKTLDPSDYTMERISYGDAFSMGADFGDGVVGGISDFFNKTFNMDSVAPSVDLSDYTAGIGDGVKDIAGNTGAIKNSLDITDEDLKYLRDIAEQEVINRFTTAEVKIDMSGMNNNISNGMDLDGVVSVMAEGVAEAIDTAAEGVHE